MTTNDDRPPFSLPPMSCEPTRAQQRFLGLTGPRRFRSDSENETLTGVALLPAAWSGLKPFLDAPGRLTGGLLYGHRADGVLHVQLIAPGGYPWWLTEGTPLDMDAHYTLGWSDCVRSLYGDTVGWVGQWLMYPDRGFAATAVDHAWVDQGRPTRLIDPECPLLVIGYDEGALRVRAYRCELGDLDIIPLTLTGVQRGNLGES